MNAKKAPKKNQSKTNEACREKIQTTQILNRLQDHALGLNDMTPTQLKAAEILLRKNLPDLAAITLQGGDEPVKLAFSWLSPQ